MELVNSYTDVISKAVSFRINIKYDISLSFFEQLVTPFKKDVTSLLKSGKILVMPEMNSEIKYIIQQRIRTGHGNFGVKLPTNYSCDIKW